MTRLQDIAEKVETAVDTYGNMLFRICLVMLGNERDAEDVVQDTMLKLLQKAPAFESPEHQKAWLIRTASNRCKDIKRFQFRHPQIDMTELQEYTANPEDSGILEALMGIPEKFRIVLILYHVEGYHTYEIGKMLGKSASAIKMRLQKGHKLLKEKYRNIDELN